ncbi:alpha/beta hydrolase [Methylophilus sp.]|uniref:alpha/beta hydrolase n=1 Tax=Methylophilus sp. TaxID=29541 RepID=UPI004036C6D9
MAWLSPDFDPCMLNTMWSTSFEYSKTRQAISLQVFGKREGKRRQPVLIYFHGGLFNCGKVEDAYAIAGALCRQAVVICVDYPLAPCMHFPDTIEVAYECLAWLGQHAQQLGADSKTVFVAGEQAGGNLAAVLAMLFRDRGMGSMQLSGQILINPMLDALQTSRSMAASMGANMAASSDSPCRRAWAEYIHVNSNATHPYASPVNSCRLAGLAPALVITSHEHPLRDEAEAYAGKLLLAGVPMQVQRLEDGAHQLSAAQHPSFATVCQLIRHFMAD